jgi:hypothetical protein
MAGRVGCRLGGALGFGSRRHPVADNGHRSPIDDVEVEGVLVAGMAVTLVGHAGGPAEIDLMVVTGTGLAEAADRAVPVGSDGVGWGAAADAGR